MITIKQNKGFGDIEIDDREKDCILIWFLEKNDSNVVIVQREYIQELIQQLQNIIKS